MSERESLVAARRTMYKVCTKCKESKMVKGFSKDRSKQDGLTSACRECNNNREKKRRANGGDFTKEQKQATFRKYGHFCQICNSSDNLQVDHKLPQHICRSHTGSVEDNAWILCKACNIAKGTKILLEVLASMPKEVLAPMLLQNYASEIANRLFDKLAITIGGKSFTEVKLNNSKQLESKTP